MIAPDTTPVPVACRASDLRHATRDTGPLMVGYARVFARPFALADEIAALRAAGCAEVYSDDARGAGVSRSGLAAALGSLRPGDCLAVVGLDRLTWRYDCLLQLMAEIGDRGAHLWTLVDGFDTRAAHNPFGIFRALDYFNGSVTVARAAETGLSDPRHKVTASEIEQARARMDSGEMSADEAAKALGIHRSSLYRRLDAAA